MVERRAVEDVNNTGTNRVIVAGLDMSYSGTGFFLKNEDTFDIKTIKTTPKTCANELLRIRYIVDSVMDRLPEPDKVSVIGLEDFYIPQSKLQMGSAMPLVMLGTTMRLALYENGYSFYIPTANQIKKFATGKGNCDKSIVVREVFKKWHIEAADDNQADACAMAYMGLAIYDVLNGNDLDSWVKYQVETVKKVVKERPNFNLD